MTTEREQLSRLVKQWNENRLDLFHLTQPTEDLEIEGVMRFYFQDVGERVSTKCIRVSSTATTRAVIDALVEKFVPDLKMLTDPEYSLWEVHEGGEERKLDLEEKPLVVQLMWHRDDREGRFLLKKHGSQYLPLSALQLHDDKDSGVLKRFSKKPEKELKKKHQGIVSVNAGREEDYAQSDIYQQVPATTFTRTISNPEVVMKKRRERKLEAKLNEMGQQGGSLKVYGAELDATRTYVTLLVSMRDRAAQILREALEKYNLGHLNLEEFCLVESTSPPDIRRSMNDLNVVEHGSERLLHPDECPLITIANRPPGAPEVFFHIRRRPSHYNRISNASSDISRGLPSRGFATDPAFVLQTADGSRGVVLPVMDGVTEVGSDKYLAEFSPQNIILGATGVHGRHCVINFEQGVVTLTPSAADAYIEVNGRPIAQTAILNEGDLIRLGPECLLRYVHSKAHADHLPPPSFSHQLQQRRLSGSSMGSTTRASQAEAESANPGYETPQIAQQMTNIPQGPPMSIQVGDYKVWDFLNEVLSHGSEESFRLAPSFALYLALRFFHTNHKPYLVQFISRIASQLAQRTQECDKAEELLFWLANASELSFLVDSDCEIRPLAQQQGASLSACVEPLLRKTVDVLTEKLLQAPEVFFDENVSDEQATNIVITVLDAFVRSARSVRLNAALTIQIASRLLHILNATLFNALIGKQQFKPRLTHSLGERLKPRIGYLMAWADRNGLELAAECQLHTITQASSFLAAPKTDIEEMGACCDKLNSAQVKRLFDLYFVGENEPPLEEEVVQAVIGVAERHGDTLSKNLEESTNFGLPFLMPTEGYVTEHLRGAPEPLLAYILRLQQRGLLHQAATLDPRSTWLVRQPTTNGIGAIQQQPITAPKPQPPPQLHNIVQPGHFGDSTASSYSGGGASGYGGQKWFPEEIVRVSLTRGPGGIGLSIVAGQGNGDPCVGIYVKKVIDGGNAALDGRLAVGDQLLSVNGIPLMGITQEDAASRMARAGPNVCFEVRKGAAQANGLAHWLNAPTTPNMGSTHQPLPMPSQQPGYQHFPKQPSYVQKQPGVRVPQQLAEPPRHQRSNSASDLYSHDPNVSISGRSICSSDFAPAGAGGTTRLPSRYRPTVIQPGRSSSGAQSPSALRKGAPSPTGLYRPPSEVPMARPSSINDQLIQPRPQQPPPVMERPPKFVSSPHHQQQPSTSSNHPLDPIAVPIFRAQSSGLQHPPPPVAQSSPRMSSGGPHIYSPIAEPPLDRDNYANLPLHRPQQAPPSPDPNSHYRSPRDLDLTRPPMPGSGSRPFSYTQGAPAVQLVKKEPAIVRPLEPNMAANRQPESRTTTFGVTGAVPTPLVALQQNGKQLKPVIRNDPLTALDRDVRNLDNMSRHNISMELDLLEMKGINMSDGEQMRYRQLLDEKAAERRDPQPRQVRHETVIDDVDPRHAYQLETSPLRLPQQYIQDIEPADSPAITGSHEVYRDPRTRRLNEIQAQNIQPSVDGAHLGFQDKMKLFAKQIGESTPKDRAKESSAQRQIERD
ncbi:unnamed protein product, partial [Mesorhabditis spiculigera]